MNQHVQVVLNGAVEVGCIFPHQLHHDSPLIGAGIPLLLIEESLFFRQFPFHKQKLAFHRASMQYYKEHLHQRGCEAAVVETSETASDIRQLIPILAGLGVRKIQYLDPTDDWLSSRIRRAAQLTDITLVEHPSQLFLTDLADLEAYFSRKKTFYQKDFYLFQRRRLDVLVEADGQPTGGQWVFDAQNRKKYPAGMKPPQYSVRQNTNWWNEAVDYVNTQFPHHPGVLEHQYYPVSHADTHTALRTFLQERFSGFGDYQDAIVSDQSFLHHSVLSPMINTGLLHPGEVLTHSLAYASEHDIPLNSVEGFIRQLIGWREFIRAVYALAGAKERTRHFWGFSRKIPASFWTGTTGIAPIDRTVKKVLHTGYCHHIERLMVLGNFMLLCEFDPDDVYRWFMTFFIDAYDWVMVPNVYGMSQFADGGMMSTKPYLSGSNYLKKMSDYPPGEWQQIWDALFWRFMHVHQEFFMQNPRLGMLLRTWDRFSEAKQQELLTLANHYLDTLDQSGRGYL